MFMLYIFDLITSTNDNRLKLLIDVVCGLFYTSKLACVLKGVTQNSEWVALQGHTHYN